MRLALCPLLVVLLLAGAGIPVRTIGAQVVFDSAAPFRLPSGDEAVTTPLSAPDTSRPAPAPVTESQDRTKQERARPTRRRRSTLAPSDSMAAAGAALRAASSESGLSLAILAIPVSLALGFVFGRRRRSTDATTPLRPARWPVSWFSSGDEPYAFQNTGERLLSAEVLRHVGPPDWHLMNHVTLPVSDGTTQVDHILVSRFGVFVIETKHHAGWIAGDAAQSRWTKVTGRKRTTFQNPIHQNYRHVCAVRELLDVLPADAIRSLVVFTGAATFAKSVPDGVMVLSEVAAYLRAQTEPVMSLAKMQYCVGRLETSRLALSRETDVEHVARLQRRFGSA